MSADDRGDTGRPWLDDAELLGLVGEDPPPATPWGDLADAVIWAACMAVAVWGYVNLLIGVVA